MHQADDVHERGALMVARAARAAAKSPTRAEAQAEFNARASCNMAVKLRVLAIADAALARAIDAVPGRG